MLGVIHFRQRCFNDSITDLILEIRQSSKVDVIDLDRTSLLDGYVLTKQTRDRDAKISLANIVFAKNQREGLKRYLKCLVAKVAKVLNT